MLDFASACRRLPLVAILRGVKPEEVVAIAQALVREGFSLIEVPLNSPDPMRSIALLREALDETALVGAGTVLTVQALEEVRAAGGRLILAPNCDARVIERARDRGLASMPGVATVTEAFAALEAGADSLKLFPAASLGAATIGAWRAVLPPGVPIFGVGGVDETSFAEFVKQGATGFGLGSSLYRPGDSAEVVAARGRRAVEAWRRLAAPVPKVVA
jgi:2-dehydro-3-deoxyphosphogalactonate aldolase